MIHAVRQPIFEDSLWEAAGEAKDSCPASNFLLTAQATRPIDATAY